MTLLAFGYLHDAPAPEAPRVPLPLVYEPASPWRWAYQVVTLDPREEPPLAGERLAALGHEGWLLAGMVPLAAAGVIERLVYYFVRPATPADH